MKAIWLRAKWIEGHAIIPDWPSSGGAQRVCSADEAEAALRAQAEEIASLNVKLEHAWAGLAAAEEELSLLRAHLRDPPSV